jgi:hypothetical protein
VFAGNLWITRKLSTDRSTTLGEPSAAFVAAAGVIVTQPQALSGDRLPEGIAVLAPSQFAENTVALSPARAWAAIEAIVRRSGRYGRRFSSSAVLELLESRYGMVQAAGLLRQAAM